MHSKKTAVERIRETLTAQAEDVDPLTAIEEVRDSIAQEYDHGEFSAAERVAVRQYIATLTEPQATFYALYRKGHLPSEIATILGVELEPVYRGLAKVLAGLCMELTKLELA